MDPDPQPSRLRRSVALTVLAVALSTCSGQAAEPVDPADPGDMSDITHRLEPTEQMRVVAVQQCLDDPDIDVGYVKAVAPETGDVLSELEIDCAEARSEG